MTQTAEGAVTAERFASGLTYQQYLDQIKVNQDQFKANYDGTTVSEEDATALRALVAKPNGPAKMLVLGEDWCPDVFRGMPVLARIAEASGMEMRVFPRDEHLDLIDQYLKDGQFRSIPVAVFFTSDMKYILHWIERPQQAEDEMPQMRKLFEGRTREEAAPDVATFREGPVWAGWRDATVKELRKKLEEKVQ